MVVASMPENGNSSFPKSWVFKEADDGESPLLTKKNFT
jgi:hypothetical protein